MASTTKASKNQQLNLIAESASSEDVLGLDQDKLNITEKNRSSVLPWRGQFSPQLIDYLLESHASKGDVILDPFCGSGTVLYESAGHSMSAHGLDINPAAILLAQASTACSLSEEARKDLFAKLGSVAANLKSHIHSSGDLLAVEQAVALIDDDNVTDIDRALTRALLLASFKDARECTSESIVRGLSQIGRLLDQVPYATVQVSARIGDARDMPFEDGFFDYVVTSPPYINVFNYHQNYRPIVEALGYVPLNSARAEVGANRKFRQNRFITVAQYCIDMALFFAEVSRVLKPNSLLTIVLGRVSSVRGVSFKNGQLIADIAGAGLGGALLDWQSRQFLNRFGETIFEDVLTIRPKAADRESAINVGRSVGTSALSVSLASAPADRTSEMEAAIEAGKTVDPSPYVMRQA